PPTAATTTIRSSTSRRPLLSPPTTPSTTDGDELMVSKCHCAHRYSMVEFDDGGVRRWWRSAMVMDSVMAMVVGTGSARAMVMDLGMATTMVMAMGSAAMVVCVDVCDGDGGLRGGRRW
ncbi:hypothetical protein Dimus_032126, partial [Dionaea muscipula]